MRLELREAARWPEKSADGVIPDDIGRTQQHELTEQLIRARYELGNLQRILADDSDIFIDVRELARDGEG